MEKILCIDGDLEFFVFLQSALSPYCLTQTSTLKEAFQLIQSGREYFDIVLVDILLADESGLKSLVQLKESIQNKLVPFVIISSHDDVLTQVAAFGIGAEDYLIKPVNPLLLKARIEARIRCAKLYQQNTQQIYVGDLLIDSDRMTVERISNVSQRVLIELTPFEFKLLKQLAVRPGQVYTRDQLIDHVWGLSKYITQRTVDAHISHLRKKLIGSEVNIETVLTIGYKLTLNLNEKSRHPLQGP